MNKVEIKAKILEVINDKIEGKKITSEQADDDLAQLGLDSFKFISIIVAFEEIFEIEVPDEYLLITEMGTVNKMVKVISEALQNKNTE